MARRRGVGSGGLAAHPGHPCHSLCDVFENRLLERCRKPLGFRHLDAEFRGAEPASSQMVGWEPQSSRGPG
jgi:hypothetical protein